MTNFTYTDKMPPDYQIDTEEYIASKIFDAADGNLHEEKCAELSRSILLHVLALFRPDLVTRSGL